jgi:dipeptide/tripeptide permease
MAAGSAILAVTSGLSSYAPALVIITAGYALFQAANNTAVTTSSAPGERGVVAGLLSLSRNLGLITGASAMGAVFALAQDPEQGLHLTFAVAAILMAAGLAIALGWSNQARDTQNAAGR